MKIKLTNTERDYLRNGLAQVIYDDMGDTFYITQLRKVAYNYMPDKILNLLEKQKSSLQPNPYINNRKYAYR